MTGNTERSKKGRGKIHMWCPQVWAQQQSLLLVVSWARHSGKGSICLDLCLNINPDCLASPSSRLPPFLSPTRPSSLFVVQGHSLGSVSVQVGAWMLHTLHGSAILPWLGWSFPTDKRERGGEARLPRGHLSLAGHGGKEKLLFPLVCDWLLNLH